MIDGNLGVYSGECRHDYLGSALGDFNLVEETICRRDVCSGCTDDLMVEKHAPVEQK